MQDTLDNMLILKIVCFVFLIITIFNLHKYIILIKKFIAIKQNQIHLSFKGYFLFIVLALTILVSIMIVPLVASTNKSTELIAFTLLIYSDNLIFYDFSSKLNIINKDICSINFDDLKNTKLFKK